MNKFIFFEKVYMLVKLIPEGKVMTYGQIATILGSPYYARRVGQAMYNIPSHLNLPWHRVVKSNGQLSNINIRVQQKKLLQEEGVIFKNTYTINNIKAYLL